MERVIVIVGPTGVGKTKLSIELAKKYNGEIINGDSVQIYRRLNIGSAKITETEKEGIPHHLFDIKEPNEDYTIYNYQKDARNKIREIQEKNKTPIIVGGSGLYIKAALFDYDLKEEISNENYEKYTNEQLLDQIKKINEEINIHVNNRKRLERVLNKLNNKSTPDKEAKLLYNAVFIGLTTDRKTLYNIINNRVDKMFETGLLNEVEKLYKEDIKSKSMSSIGYKELYQYFDNKISLEEAKDLIKKNSRHFAKRQYTWFNNQMDIKWVEVDFNNFEETIKEIENNINKGDKR